MSILRRSGVVIAITVAAATMLGTPALAALWRSPAVVGGISTADPTTDPTSEPSREPAPVPSGEPSQEPTEPQDTCEATASPTTLVGLTEPRSRRLMADDPKVICIGTYIQYEMKADAKAPTITLKLRKKYTDCKITTIELDPKTAGTIKDNVITTKPGVLFKIITKVKCGDKEYEPDPLVVLVDADGNILIPQG